MTDTVLVLAATGKTGTPLVGELLRRGALVRAATRSPEQASLPDDAEPVRFDWHDEGTWRPALAGVDAVYLVTPDVMTSVDAQVRPFVSLALEAGARRLVHLSADGVQHAPDDVHLRAAELATLRSGAEFAGVLRGSWFDQNFHASFFAPGIVERGELAAPAGDGRVGFVDTRDIAAVAATMLLGETDVTEATATGPQALSFAEAAAALSRGTGRDITYTDVPPEGYRDVMAAAGIPDAYQDILLGLFEGIRAGHAATVSDDMAAIVGREPIPVEQYARDHAAQLGA